MKHHHFFSKIALLSLSAMSLTIAELTTGNGAFEYTLHPELSDTSKVTRFGPTHGGVAVSKKTGNVYVSNNSGQGIAIFNKNGEFQNFLAPEFTHLHSLHLLERNGEELLVGAQGHKGKGLLFKLDGTLVQEVTPESAGLPKDSFQGLTAATLDRDGNWYLATGYGAQKIFKCDPNGKLILEFGGSGAQPEKFACAHGLRVDYRSGTPLLLICDRRVGKLKHFTLDGKFHSIHAEGLRRPCTFDFHGSNIAVAELAGRATILDKDGNPLSFLGDNPDAKQHANFSAPPESWNPEYFTAPHGISYTPEGNIWVQDWNQTGRLHFLKKKH